MSIRRIVNRQLSGIETRQRMAEMGTDMPFDHKRTAYGGFTALVKS